MNNPIMWGMICLLICLGLVFWYCAHSITKKPNNKKTISEEGDLADRIAEDPDNRHN